MPLFSRTTKLSTALVGSLFLVGVSALAQQAAPAAATVAPVVAPTISAAQLALARQIVNGSGLTRSFEATVPQMMVQINQAITRTRPELGPDLKGVLTTLVAEFSPQTSQMVDQAALIFASKMSEAEMKDIAAFFASDSGKKYVSVQPVAVDEVVVAMDEWRKILSGAISERVRAEMKKKGHDL